MRSALAGIVLSAGVAALLLLYLSATADRPAPLTCREDEVITWSGDDYVPGIAFDRCVPLDDLRFGGNRERNERG